MKSGGAAVIGFVVLELTVLDWVEDVVVALEDVVLEDVAIEDVVLEDVAALEEVVVLTEDVVCADLG